MFPIHYYAGQTAVVHQDPSPNSSLLLARRVVAPPLRALFPSIPLCARFSSSRSAPRSAPVSVCVRARARFGRTLSFLPQISRRPVRCWCLTHSSLALSLALSSSSSSYPPGPGIHPPILATLPYDRRTAPLRTVFHCSHGPSPICSSRSPHSSQNRPERSPNRLSPLSLFVADNLFSPSYTILALPSVRNLQTSDCSLLLSLRLPNLS